MSRIDSLLKLLSNYIDWRAGDIEDMPDPKQITLVLKKCHNLIYDFDIQVRHSKDAKKTIEKLKELLK
jgi:hypothetical protein